MNLRELRRMALQILAGGALLAAGCGDGSEDVRETPQPERSEATATPTQASPTTTPAETATEPPPVENPAPEFPAGLTFGLNWFSMAGAISMM